MAKLYLHIGLHKTASSSFQLSCASNQAELLRQKIAYPLFACAGTSQKEIENHSIPLFSLYTQDPSQYPINLRWQVPNLEVTNESYQEQLRHALNQKNDLLLSGEDIASLEPDELSHLRNDLEASGRELVVFACVRSPYAFHCSQVQQQVKDGVAMNPAGLCPQRHRIKKLVTVFGDSIHWIPFRKACQHSQGPVGSFFSFCRIDSTNISIRNSNEGRCAEHVRIQNLLNHQQPRIRDGQLNPQHIRLKPFEGSRFLLTPCELSAVNDHLNTENAELERLLGPGFGDPDRPTSNESFGSQYPTLTYNLTLLIGLLLQQQASPIRTTLSLQDVQHFLLASCDEADLKHALCNTATTSFKTLSSKTTSSANDFDQSLVPLAQQFIRQLYN